MKNLKFHPDLIPLILSEKKTSTWRLFDDKNLTAGDEIVCIDSYSNKSFAKVVLTDVKSLTFQELTDEDKAGHEEFLNDKEMLKIYSKYYNTEATLDTSLKIVRFKILEKL